MIPKSFGKYANPKHVLLFAAMIFIMLLSHFSFSNMAYAQISIVPTLDTGGYDQIDQGNGEQMDIVMQFKDGATFGFAWDDADLSGSNTRDVCGFFLEGDGTITAFCYSVLFSDGVIASGYPEYEVYDCGTQYGNGKCAGNFTTSDKYAASCEDPALVTQYFSEDPDRDLQAACTMTSLNGNDVDDLLFINTCSKPSAELSSLSNDCIFDPSNRAPDPGFLQLVKTFVDGDTGTPRITRSLRQKVQNRSQVLATQTYAQFRSANIL